MNKLEQELFDKSWESSETARYNIPMTLTLEEERRYFHNLGFRKGMAAARALAMMEDKAQVEIKQE